MQGRTGGNPPPLTEQARRRPYTNKRGDRAADECNERAAPHSITSSASSKKDSGIDNPRAFAVLRLTRSAKWVG
jgi:hypothetical protein